MAYFRNKWISTQMYLSWDIWRRRPERGNVKQTTLFQLLVRVFFASRVLANGSIKAFFLVKWVREALFPSSLHELFNLWKKKNMEMNYNSMRKRECVYCCCPIRNGRALKSFCGVGVVGCQLTVSSALRCCAALWGKQLSGAALVPSSIFCDFGELKVIAPNDLLH